MIKLNSYKKYNILYRNYIKQYSKAYISGSHLYVGDSLNNASYIKKLYIEQFIKKYSNNFIKLYMNNNKIHNELYGENLCIICLEDLNEDIIDICHKCNVKCHIDCLNNWYKKNENKICPICLKSEEYYLNILKNKNNTNSSTNSNIIDNGISNIQTHLIYCEVLNKLFFYCCIFTFITFLFFFIIYY